MNVEQAPRKKSSNGALDLDGLLRDGFTYLRFNRLSYLDKIQRLCEHPKLGEPIGWHAHRMSQGEHINYVKDIADRLYQEDAVIDLIKGNIGDFQSLLGPDINCQVKPHLRISRPESESDFIDWHRDTYYGNTPWEVNLWFPVYPLAAGAGLVILPGSHRVPAVGIRNKQDPDPFRREVKKGSVAHQLGYVYQPKTDDYLEACLNGSDPPSRPLLLAPNHGQAVLFFGCCAHRAQNTSSQTRVTIDLRLCNMHIKTECKPGYYRALTRGIVQQVASAFLQQPDPLSPTPS